MDNSNTNTHAAGAWDDADGGSEVFNDGRCKLTAVSTGIVKVTLTLPLAEDQFSIALTQNGDPVDAYFGVIHTSDTEKNIVSKSGGDDHVDTSFGFTMFQTNVSSV